MRTSGRQGPSWRAGGLLAAWVVVLLTGVSGCPPRQERPGRVTPPADRIVWTTPTAVGLPYEDLVFLNRGGQRLRGWHIPADGATRTVLIHGPSVVNRGALLAHAKLFHELGCDVVLYDYQGYGNSDGVAELDSLYGDAESALAALVARPEPEARRVVVFGVSMGTLPAIAQAAAGHPQVEGLIVEGAFDPRTLPSWSYLLGGVVDGRKAIEQGPQELLPDRNLPRVRVPKLFLHSMMDGITPIEGAESLYAEAGEPKRFVRVMGAHATSVVADPAYRAAVKRFLSVTLESGPPAAPTAPANRG